MVVGADGTFSKVRPIVTDERPRYTGELDSQLASQPGRVEAATRHHAHLDPRPWGEEGVGPPSLRRLGRRCTPFMAVTMLPRRALTLAGSLGLNNK